MTEAPKKVTDLEKMFEEMRDLCKRYNVPRGMLFVPDKIEIRVQRLGEDKFSLVYQESFDYLPSNILDLVVPLTIGALVRIGFESGCIRRTDRNGIRVESTGSLLDIAGGIFSEVLIQRKLEEGEVSSLFDDIAKTRRAFADLYELEFKWDEEVERRYNDNLQNLARITEEHPSIQAELEAISNKYGHPPDSGK
jgi:hypothetical protein